MLTEKTKKIYDEFAWFARTGETTDLEFSKPEGLAHYRRLVRNVTDNTLQNAFPIASKLINKGEWDSLVNDFMRNHDSKTSSIWKLPKEFVEFFEQNNFAQKLNRYYLNDLLRLEWTEIDVFTRENARYPAFSNIGDFLSDKLLVNKIYEIIELEYPVHIMAVNEAQKNKGKYFVLIFRDFTDLSVKFMNLSNTLVLVIKLLREKSLNSIIQYFIQDLSEYRKIEIDRKIIEFVKVLFENHFILGYKK